MTGEPPDRNADCDARDGPDLGSRVRAVPSFTLTADSLTTGRSMPNSFHSLTSLEVDDRTFRIFRLDSLGDSGVDLARLPFSLKILLENLLRNEDGTTVTADDILGLARWDPKAIPSREIAFRPSRVLLQDFTGVPAIVDLAAMRDAMKRLGGDPSKINPLQPVELVIDHSVQVDEAGTAGGLPDQRQPGIQPEPRALRLPPLGPGRVPELPGRPPRHRDRPPGESRIPGPRRLLVDRHRGRRGRPRCRWPIPTRWSAPTRTRR